MYQAMVEPSSEVGIFGHGYTYTGHPAACAVALKTLEIYERENLFLHAAKMGERMQAKLKEVADHPLVGEVRGKGLIGAVELVANKKTGQSFKDGSVGAYAKQASQEHGLLIRAVAGNSLAFCPPLIVKEDQVDEMVDKFKLALEDTMDHVHASGLLEN